jgi:hypothetical protein
MKKLLSKWFAAVTRHYSLHMPEHVGAYAGAYLERRDWDH